MESATNESEGISAAISREMVRLYKDLFGRGPTKASTTIARDLVVCTLEDSLTPAERKMAEMGEHRAAPGCPDVLSALERERIPRCDRAGHRARKVRAFVSGIDTTQDVSAEVFYLEAEEGRPQLDGQPQQ